MEINLKLQKFSSFVSYLQPQITNGRIFTMLHIWSDWEMHLESKGVSLSSQPKPTIQEMLGCPGLLLLYPGQDEVIGKGYRQQVWPSKNGITEGSNRWLGISLLVDIPCWYNTRLSKCSVGLQLNLRVIEKGTIHVLPTFSCIVCFIFILFSTK